jgi:hypothetical protein
LRPIPPTAPFSPVRTDWMIIAMLLAAVVWAVTGQRRRAPRRGRAPLIAMAASLLLALALAACGGGGGGGGVGGGGGNPGTPAGTYNLIVTGTESSGSSTLSHSVTMTLNVS